ncbi:MAG: ABC transporter permease subunit [SAR324 cluster bacterium]|nr:ABC transporter permease subunit [SAR324 cluster bacterium]
MFNNLPRCTLIKAILKRELASYFYSPIAYVFVSIFVLALAATTIFIGRMFDTNQANLDVMFAFLPWVLLFLVPAVGMQLWSDEQSTGSIELLLTFPVTITEAVIAKFLAGWIFLCLSLVATIFFPITVFILGSPDLGKILLGYLGSIFLAGTYLAISGFTSAMTSKQVISFVFSFIICFFLTIIGWGIFSDLLNQFLPVAVTDFISSFGVIAQFDNFKRGILEIKAISYYSVLIAGCLALTVRILEEKRLK